METLNYSHVSGDTCLGWSFELKNELGAIDITNALIELYTDRDKATTKISSATNGFIKTDPTAGKFKLAEQVIAWNQGEYNIGIRISFPSGRKKTYVQGLWTIS